MTAKLEFEHNIENFNWTNFHLWKFKIQIMLEDKDLFGIVCGEKVQQGREGTTDVAIRKFRKRAIKGMVTICLSLKR